MENVHDVRTSKEVIFKTKNIYSDIISNNGLVYPPYPVLNNQIELDMSGLAVYRRPIAPIQAIHKPQTAMPTADVL